MNKLPNRNNNVEKELIYMMLLLHIIYIMRRWIAYNFESASLS